MNLAETCADENPVQFVTDYTVEKNVVSDTRMIQDRLPALQGKMDVSTVYADGGYYGADVQTQTQELEMEMQHGDDWTQSEFGKVAHQRLRDRQPANNCRLSNRSTGDTQRLKSEESRAVCPLSGRHLYGVPIEGNAVNLSWSKLGLSTRRTFSPHRDLWIGEMGPPNVPANLGSEDTSKDFLPRHHIRDGCLGVPYWRFGQR